MSKPSFEIRIECLECGEIYWVVADDPLDAFDVEDAIESHQGSCPI